MKNRRVIWKFLKLSIRIYPKMLAVLLFSALINSLFSVFSAYSISLLLRLAEEENLEAAGRYVLIFVTIEGVLFVMQRTAIGEERKARLSMEERVGHMLSGKIMNLPFSYLEDPFYMQLKENALTGMNNMGAIYSFFHGFLMIFSNLMTIGTLGTLIFRFHPILLTVMSVGVVLILLVTALSTSSQIQFFNDLLPINYKYGYYLNTLMSDTSAKDFRLYSVYELMMEKFTFYIKEIDTYFLKFDKKMAFFSFLNSLIRYLVLGFVYCFVGVTAIQRHLTVSEFSLTVSAAIAFSQAVSAIIDGSSSFIRGLEYVKPIVEFMDMREEKEEGSIELKEIETIEFEHVSFTYPNTSVKVLDDISFIIQKNEKISIVGLNGAGKTTIIKLLCKLYKPNEGCIKVNGINIYDYAYGSYMAQISTVFQDYKHFNYSILDNIKPELEEEEGRKILKQVGLLEAVDALPKGIHTNIGKNYDKEGIELSGGQLQKIAIARSLIKPAQILILDEPTSALDPLAEAAIYEDFNTLAKNRLAIYISHRMSSSIFCDRILVLNDGKIEDFDTHSNLMKKKDSLYYKLFSTQAENYQL